METKIIVYAIKSLVRTYIYAGQTNNLEKRFKQHNNGLGRSTKPYKPFEIIYTKAFNNRREARMHEKYLKSGSGKEFLKSLIT